MKNSIWGKDQLAFFLDGSFSDTVDHRVAHGLVNYSTTPSTVYVFTYDGREKAVQNIIGKHGVTCDSVVIDNSSRKDLGSVKKFCDLSEITD